MHLLGISTRRPSFHEFTAASLMALGLWLLVAALLWRFTDATSRFDLGAAALVCWWGCLAARFGIRPDLGLRHLAVQLGVGGLLLGGYSAAWALLG